MTKRRFAKPVLLLTGLAVLGAVISGCAFVVPGSLTLSQPAGVGAVRVHFKLCNEPADETELSECKPNTAEGQLQYLLGIAVPPGSVAPEQITAVANGGGAPIVFHRNAEVAAQIGKLSGFEGEFPVWPPAGTEAVGYLSDPYTEEKGTTRELLVDADFGLPTPSDGGAFGGPFRAALAFGFRPVSPEFSASRPVNCVGPETGMGPEDLAFCFPTGDEAQIGTSDLRVAAPKTTSVFVGGKAPVNFGLAFASTATTAASFRLSATSTLKGAKAQAPGTFVPGTLDPSTHRAPAASGTATVTVPKNAKPGVYDVVLTATAPQGGSVSATAKLKVVKPKLKVGGAKLDRAKGTATLTVNVPGAGTLTVAGKGVVKVKKTAKKAKSFKIKIRASGAAKAALLGAGSSKVKPKLTFKPKSGSPVSKTKPVTLKLS